MTIRATITQPATDGVILAHGGATVGYSLYLKEGHLIFAARHAGKLSTVVSKEPLPVGALHLAVTLAKDGSVVLLANDIQVGTGKVPGAMERQPSDGLQVGQDKNAAVGDYAAPFLFKGEIGEVTIEVGKE